MSNETVDLESLSLEEIRALADAEEAKAAPVVEDAAPEVADSEQPRDANGRFLPKSEATPAAEVPAAVADEPVVYERRLDLGDGSGVQVFRGDTFDELVDKLVTAQINASKKIREQAVELEARKAKEQADADDNNYVDSQEMMSKPTEAFKKIFKRETGMDITEIKSVVERQRVFEAAEVQRQQDAASEAFLQAHPNYEANDKNGERLEREIVYLAQKKTSKGEKFNYHSLIEEAYQSLKSDGLPAFQDEEAHVVQEEPKAPAERIAPKAEADSPTQRTPVRKSSELSTRTRTTVPVKSQGPTEEELYSMPLEKLRELDRLAQTTRE